MKLLVTGADGFIGSHLTEWLVRAGHDVRAFVYYNSFNSWGWLDNSPSDIKSSIEVVAGDIRDENSVRNAVRGVDCVYHLAALIAIPYSYHAPSSYIDTNISGTLNVVQAVRDFEIPKVVHTSTSEVYGTADFVPITEAHPLKGQSPYSASKIGADQIAISFHRSFNTPVAIARPFNTYGPRQSARAVIPTIISQIAGGAETLKLGDLSPTRDFNFVEDTVRGFDAIGQSEKSIGEVINLGTGFEITIADMVDTIIQSMNSSVKVVQDPSRMRPKNSEVFRLCADATKAGELTEWAPDYAGLDGLKRGIQKTIDWFTQPENLAFYKTGVYNI